MEPKPTAETRHRARFVEVSLPLPLPQCFTYAVAGADDHHPAIGDAINVPFGRRKLVGVVTGVPERADGIEGLREILGSLPAPYRIPKSCLELARWMAEYYGCSWGEALALFLPPKPGTAARRSPLPKAELDGGEAPLDPSPEQAQALKAMAPQLVRGGFASFLLHGVTGSGKTEVYLQAVARVLERGRRALVLLPEIALTPQTLRRLTERFPGQVAPYHSRLSHGERCAVWEAAASGRISVVVGPRSAAFLPLPDLGLIVVDEEHEPSYKADDRPRYHARDVALMRGKLEEVPVILGSATPSLESYHNAQQGKHILLTLPSRMGTDALPSVEIVDQRLRKDRLGGPVGEALAEALDEALRRNEQAIVFHNRRGYARFLQCHGCGHVEPCPHCDISLTWHIKDDRLHCHYCGHRKARPERCGACGERLLRPKGTGTQRVELALSSRFPSARILRLDQDTTGSKEGHRLILDAFGRGEADILLGTQMVAKGLHFPRVTVVGVISADVGLHFPDFRAHERAFQLLAQVAGRSGREGPGRVLLQTYDPEHRVLVRAAEHDVLGFLDEELEQRLRLGYPPSRRLAAITASAADEAVLDRALVQLAARLSALFEGRTVDILGPARAALPRIKRRHRGQLLLKGALGKAEKVRILELFEALRRQIPGGRGLDLALDVDPQHLL